MEYRIQLPQYQFFKQKVAMYVAIAVATYVVVNIQLITIDVFVTHAKVQHLRPLGTPKLLLY